MSATTFAFKVHRHSYQVDGTTDAAVMASLAERRRDKLGETTILHAHPYEFKKRRNAKRTHETPCTAECRVVQPGFKTRGINEVPEPMEEDE